MKKRTKELIVVLIAVAIVLWVFDPFSIRDSEEENTAQTAELESPRGNASDVMPGSVDEL